MKNIFDYSPVKSVSAIALIDMKTKEPCGKIVASWSDNPNGSVCTAQVIIHNAEKFGIVAKERTVDLMGNPTKLPCILMGKAGGYGYDKLSSAISEALYRNTKLCPEHNFAGVGINAVQTWFEEELNITFITVI